jgi:SAM-dependent methyltransferase
MSGDDVHDWEIVARDEPFFGVVGADDFRMARMDGAAKARFYASGERDIEQVLAWFEADLGARPRGGRALDFGCGVGRLTRVIAGHVNEAVGHDVSESMLARAREVVPANVSLTTAFPDGRFDWVNSYIVFQHIPPAEGLVLLQRCLAAIDPGGFASIQITGWRDGPQASSAPYKKLARWLERWRHRQPGASSGPLIRMYDYDFCSVVRVFAANGFPRVVMRHTEHAGHHGAWFIARREA